MQSLILKSLDYVNDHPNENGPNTKLKSLYNVSKVSWILNYGMVIFLPHHMNSILMEVWYACNVSVRNIISDKFVKKATPIITIDFASNTQACVASVQVSYGTKDKDINEIEHRTIGSIEVQ